MDEKTRFVIFLTIFILITSLEIVIPELKRKHILKSRWFTNIGLSAFNVFIGAFIFIHIAKFTFSLNADLKWGLFFKLSLPTELELLFSILFLDLAIYFQHMATHKIPLLWKLHQVHHHDLFLDATSGIRFHTIEIILSYTYKMILVFFLGISIQSLLIFEMILNGSALFNHGNFKLPKTFNKLLRILIVTPQMHRIHHSPIKSETDSNYGFFFSFWDRIFNTFTPRTGQNKEEINFGVQGVKLSKDLNLLEILLLPFKKLKERKI